MEAVILSRRDFREYDQIVSVYTREEGKQELLVRGVKKIVSKNSPHLEPTTYILVDTVSGKEMRYITTAQSIETFFGVRGNEEKIVAARHALDFVELMTQGGVRDDSLCRLLLTWMKWLDREDFCKMLGRS